MLVFRPVRQVAGPGGTSFLLGGSLVCMFFRFREEQIILCYPVGALHSANFSVQQKLDDWVISYQSKIEQA